MALDEGTGHLGEGVGLASSYALSSMFLCLCLCNDVYAGCALAIDLRGHRPRFGKGKRTTHHGRAARRLAWVEGPECQLGWLAIEPPKAHGPAFRTALLH